jgi:hypothetical protein
MNYNQLHMPAASTNPFRYGDLALDEAFTDRAAELKELRADIRNGQNVVVFAPRRYGKSSLIWRATQGLISARQVAIAQVDLMKTPTKERLAAKLAASIYDDIATPLFKVRERTTAIFRGLRIAPTMTVDVDGSMSFSFQPGHSTEDIDATLERLLELPAQLGAERDKRVALVFDEFQEIVNIDPNLIALMRSVFQEQPEVAHVYLGSKRQMMEQIFNDANEPFWRSAKQMELGVIPEDEFAVFLSRRFEESGRPIDQVALDLLLSITHSHPYGTQEIAYAVWESTADGPVTVEQVRQGLRQVLRSENAHFSRVWEGASRAQRLALEALARDPGQATFGAAYRREHNLPAVSTLQKAIDTLIEDELVERAERGFRIAEPFLADWILSSDL